MATGSIAVIGANNDRTRYANKAVRAWAARGYRVYPVHPQDKEVEGMPAYGRVTDIPDPVNEATLYIRPSAGIRVLDDLKAKGIRRVYVNPGADSPELLAKAESLGLETIVACSIMAAGAHPSEL